MHTKPDASGRSLSQIPLRDTRRVGVIGGREPDPGSLKYAEEMGRLIAVNRYILVNGGRGGVMEASARGAHKAGGFVMAILPGHDRSEANPWVDLAVPTGLGLMRNALVALNSDILVAIDGSYGTLSEIAYGHMFSIPVLGLGTWAVKGVVPHQTPGSVLSAIRKYFEG